MGSSSWLRLAGGQVSSQCLELTLWAGLSWDECLCSTWCELGSLRCLQPVSRLAGAGCSGLASLLWRSMRTAGPHSFHAVFSSWLLTRQQPSKKESRSCKVLEARVALYPSKHKPNIQQTQLPQIWGRGGQFVAMFNLSGKALSQIQGDGEETKSRGLLKPGKEAPEVGGARAGPWWQAWRGFHGNAHKLALEVGFSWSPLCLFQLWGVKLGFLCPRRIIHLNKLHQILVLIFHLPSLKTLHFQTLKLFFRKTLYEGKAGKCLFGMCT